MKNKGNLFSEGNSLICSTFSTTKKKKKPDRIYNLLIIKSYKMWIIILPFPEINILKHLKQHINVCKIKYIKIKGKITQGT